jgi:hypothetical protein
VEDITQKKVLIFLACAILIFVLLIAIPVVAEMFN